MWLYLAGPYRPIENDSLSFSIQDNVTRAAEVAAACYEAGHTPITPHLLTHKPASFADEIGKTDSDFWLPKTQDMQRRCDATLLLPFWAHSEGAKQEKEYAEEVGMPVYEYDERVSDGADPIPPLHPTEKASPIQCEAFQERVQQMYRTHMDKNADYSPMNIMGTGELGVAVRLWDKMSRLMNLLGFEVEIPEPASYSAPQDPKNEPVDDTLLDLATYGIIGDLVRRDKWAK